MIGRLTGIIVFKQAPDLLLEVGGIGYELQAPLSAFMQLPQVGSKVTLHTHLTVREDAHLLYGFTQEKQKTLFRLLIKTNGVGPKLALGILSGMNVEEFVACVSAQNVTALTKLPGVGKKTAERLIIEMQDRLKQEIAQLEQHANNNTQAFKSSKKQSLQEAEQALIALGYRPQEAAKMLNNVDATVDNTEELIRLALKHSMGQA